MGRFTKCPQFRQEIYISTSERDYEDRNSFWRSSRTGLLWIFNSKWFDRWPNKTSCYISISSYNKCSSKFLWKLFVENFSLKKVGVSYISWENHLLTFNLGMRSRLCSIFYKNAFENFEMRSKTDQNRIYWRFLPLRRKWMVKFLE